MPSTTKLAGGGICCHGLVRKVRAARRTFRGRPAYYGSDLASIGKGPLVGWQEAVRATEAFNAIEEFRLRKDNNWIYSNNDRRFASFLNGTRELFARSYHQ